MSIWMIVSAGLGVLGAYRYYEHTKENDKRLGRTEKRVPSFWKQIWSLAKQRLPRLLDVCAEKQKSICLTSTVEAEESIPKCLLMTPKKWRNIRPSHEELQFAKAKEQARFQEAQSQKQVQGAITAEPPTEPLLLLAKRRAPAVLLEEQSWPEKPSPEIEGVPVLEPCEEELAVSQSPAPAEWKPVKIHLVRSEMVNPRDFGFEKSEIDWNRKRPNNRRLKLAY